MSNKYFLGGRHLLGVLEKDNKITTNPGSGNPEIKTKSCKHAQNVGCRGPWVGTRGVEVYLFHFFHFSLWCIQWIHCPNSDRTMSFVLLSVLDMSNENSIKTRRFTYVTGNSVLFPVYHYHCPELASFSAKIEENSSSRQISNSLKRMGVLEFCRGMMFTLVVMFILYIWMWCFQPEVGMQREQSMETAPWRKNFNMAWGSGNCWNSKC